MATDEATAALAAPHGAPASAHDHGARAGDDDVLPDADAPPPTGDEETAQQQPENTGSGDGGGGGGGGGENTAPPVVPGPRARRLQELFASSLHHTLAKVSWDNFAACYPTAAARAPQALKTVHRAMVERLGELCAAEFAVVLRNRDVVRRLNELETLTAEAAQRRQTAVETGTGTGTGTGMAPRVPPPHTLPAETVLAAHLAPLRREQRSQLQQRLQAAQAANAARFGRLAAQQAEAEQLVAALERALADAAGAAALLDGDALVAELARETRAAEVAMSEI